MYKLKKTEVLASEIAGLINRNLNGRDIIIRRPASVEDPADHSFVCVEKKEAVKIENIHKLNNVLIITDIDPEEIKTSCTAIWSDTPRLDYLRVIYDFFLIPDEIKISNTAIVHANSKISRNVSIGEHVVIGPDVIIGDGTKILHNVVIVNQVEIGKNCIIKYNSTVGSEGFDFEIDRFGIPVYYPHIGKIFIGNNVWIGSNTCVESGKIDNTIIDDDVKIDDLVQLGSNCYIGKRTLITAGTVIERNVKIGENCLISPNATVKQNVKVGNNVIIGEGSVVIHDIEPDAVYVGIPAKFLRKK